MADLTTAVGELLKKKNTEENLHIYVEGLSSLYKRMAELRLAMNYYTFAEIYSDFDFAKKTAVDPYINEIQQIINDVILLDTLSLDAVDRIDALRNRIIAKMEILTAYTDIFQIYEYVLNRVEYRFSESEFVKKITGVSNVCERAAMCAAEGGKLLVKKTAHDGMTFSAAQVIQHKGEMNLTGK